MTNLEATNNALKLVEQGNKLYANKLYLFAYNWVTKQMKSFTIDDLKTAFFAEGNDPPIEPRIFGTPFRRLSKEKLIFATDKTVKSKNVLAHNRPLTVWISKQFAEKQQKNRKIDNKLLTLNFDV